MRAAALACLLLVAASAAAAEESGLTDSDVVVKTEGPHRLLLPRDWPVEHKDGRIAPVSIETYLSLKFQQVSEALSRVDRRLSALESAVASAEEARHAQALRLKLLEDANQGR